jgi:hypothetical protein
MKSAASTVNFPRGAVLCPGTAPIKPQSRNSFRSPRQAGPIFCMLKFADGTRSAKVSAVAVNAWSPSSTPPLSSPSPPAPFDWMGSPWLRGAGEQRRRGKTRGRPRRWLSCEGTWRCQIGSDRAMVKSALLTRNGLWTDRTFPNRLAQFLIAVAASPVVAATKI